MAAWQLTKPVAFLVFNRPQTTREVFEQIRHARPPQLLIIADGPRDHVAGEAKKCATVRDIVADVNWPCDVRYNYSDVNLGCKKRISSGLTWAFDTVDEAIILEDDCLPHPTFFRYCEELLDKYRQDERIMVISGDNFQLGRRRSEFSYYYSHFVHVWGWASWSRAWKYYDVTMGKWDELEKTSWLKERFHDTASVKYWKKVYTDVHKGVIDTWDYQWTFACWQKNGLAILPHVNLISNRGFQKSGTHTNCFSPLSNLPVEPMSFPMKHPADIARDIASDDFTQREYINPNILTRIKQRLATLR